MELLAEGTVQKLSYPTKGPGYRLIRKERQPGQPVAFYFRAPCELGVDAGAGRQNTADAVKKARTRGHHIIAAGYVGWHPLYDFTDEYWGIRDWNPDKAEETRQQNRARDQAFVNSIIGKYDENIDLRSSHNVDQGLYSIPGPSPKALDIARKLASQKPFFTVGPRTRKTFEARDYHSWEMLYSMMAELGLDIYVTCPRQDAADLPCKYIQDMAGIENLMDLELAMHSQAVAAITTNTGTAGLMLYSRCPNVVIMGGTAGVPGWHNVHANLKKVPGYETRLHLPSPLYGPDDALAKDVVRILREVIK